MESDGVREEYMDVLLQEFAYDPIRLSPSEDPAQMLYNRRTLETIWVSKHEALNPYTRQPFHITNAIPQTKLRQEIHQYITENKILGLKVIPDYTKVLNESEMKYLLEDLVYNYQCFAEQKEKQEENWRVLWQKFNLIRLYCQYSAENREAFSSINGYQYLFKIIDRGLLKLLRHYYASCDDAKEVCIELARIVDLISLTQNDLETIPRKPLKVFVRILSKMGGSEYLKIGSMVLKIYCRMFRCSMIYAVGNNGTFHPCVIHIALKVLGRKNSRDVTDEDLDNGTAILKTAWMYKRNTLLSLQNYMDVVVKVVILCIARFRAHQLAVNYPGSSPVRTSISIGIALTQGLRLIESIATFEDFEGNCNHDYHLERLHILDIVKDIVGMVELVVAGFEFGPFRDPVRSGLNIMKALCKDGLQVMTRNEAQVLADFAASRVVNKYGTTVKRLLQDIINHSCGAL